MASEMREPSHRAGALSFVHNNQFYICHGDARFQREGEKLQYTRDQLLPLQRFDFSSAQWSGVSPVSAAGAQHFWTVLKRRHDGVGCALLGNCAYIHGTCWEYGYAVHELNVETMVCRKLVPKNRKDGPKRGLGSRHLHDYVRIIYMIMYEWSRVGMRLCV